MQDLVKDDIKLPFNEEFQMAIIGHSLLDQNFFINCHTKLKPNWFTGNIMLSEIFFNMQKSYEDYGLAIRSYQELLNESFFLELDRNDYDRYETYLKQCDFMATNKGFALDKIRKQLTGFIRLCMFKEAIEGAVQQFKGHGLDTAYEWTKEKIVSIQDSTFELDATSLTFDNPREWLLDENKESQAAISTGCKRLDHALGGGLFKGETSAILASLNTGKSTLMITLARHAVIQDKKVLFLTHEDSPNKIRRKIMQSIMGVSKQTLTNPDIIKNPIYKKDLDAISLKLKNQFVYLPYVKINSMYIEDVAAEIKRRHEDEIRKTGRGFDIIIDDYPKKLHSKKKFETYRSELAYIYDAFNHIAIELNVHCFVAIQTNREGLKQNMGKIKSTSNIGIDVVDESIGIAQNLGNVISITRMPDDKRFNLARLSIVKSRNEITDISINTRTAFGLSLTHGDPELFSGKIDFDVCNESTYFKPVRVSHQLALKNEIQFGGLHSFGVNDNMLRATDEIDKALTMLETKQVLETDDFENFKKGFNTNFGNKE